MKIVAIVSFILTLQTLLIISTHHITEAKHCNNTNKIQSPSIINGFKARRGQFPHQVALSLNGYFICGGSLISESWILTAAHCVAGLEDKVFSALLGVENINRTDEDTIVMNVSVIIRHQNFSTRRAECDVALLQLPQPVQYSAYVKPVFLPTSSDKRNLYEGQSVQVTGWGYVTGGLASISSDLNYANLTVISNEECNERFDLNSTSVKDSVICGLSPDGSAPCYADSGGPLVIPHEDRTFTQIGILSFGSQSCVDGKPSAYTRITSYLDWIYEVSGVGQKDINTTVLRSLFQSKI